MKNIVNAKIAVLVIMIFSLVACGGGSGENSTSNTPPVAGNGNGTAIIKKGAFDVSIVEGLSYESGNESGVTDANGQFSYEDGKNITFKVGDIIIGTIKPKTRVSLLNFVIGAKDETDETVTNIMRFLVTIDDDNDLSNGIQISSAIANQAIGVTINFTQSVTAFESNGNVITIVKNMTRASKARTRALATSLRARQALKNNLLAVYSGIYDGTFSGDDSGTWSVVIDGNGVISGDGTSTSSGRFTVTGKISSNGRANFAWGGVRSRNNQLALKTTFAGSINGAGNFSGAWSNTTTNESGLFTGTKQSTSSTGNAGTGNTGTGNTGNGNTVPLTKPFADAMSIYNTVNANFITYQSSAISIKAPDIAENGAVVPVTIASPNKTGTLWIFVDSNPSLPAARIDYVSENDHAEAVSVRLRMAATGNIIAIFDDGAGNIIASKLAVKVTIGGLSKSCNISPCNIGDLTTRKLKARARSNKFKMLISHPMYPENYITSVAFNTASTNRANVFFTSYISSNPYLALEYPNGFTNLTVSVSQLIGGSASITIQEK